MGSIQEKCQNVRPKFIKVQKSKYEEYDKLLVSVSWSNKDIKTSIFKFNTESSNFNIFKMS